MLGALGEVLLPLLEVSLGEELGLEGCALELDGGVLAPEEDEEAEPEGDDGRVLLDDDEPLEERSRCAAGPLAFRSQPYRPLSATAIGRRTKADFFNKFIWRLLS